MHFEKFSTGAQKGVSRYVHTYDCHDNVSDKWTIVQIAICLLSRSYLMTPYIT